MNTTNSMIPSSNDYIKQYLLTFLNGNVTLPELINAMKGIINIDFNGAPNHRSIVDLSESTDFKIVVSKEHVCGILNKHKQGLISELDLCNWAAVIYMLPYFVPKGETDEDRWQEGESILWEIIQHLASANSSNDLNSKVIDTFLQRLKCQN